MTHSTDHYVLRLSADERTWLMENLHPRQTFVAERIWTRLFDCEPRTANVKVEADREANLPAPGIFATEPAVKLPSMVVADASTGNLPPLADLLPPVDPRWLPDTPAEARAKADRKQILERAEHLIAVDRAATYGDAHDSFRRIGVLWSALLDHPVDAADVARMMIAMKLSRLTKAMDHADSWVDIAGYAALGAEIAEVEL